MEESETTLTVSTLGEIDKDAPRIQIGQRIGKLLSKYVTN